MNTNAKIVKTNLSCFSNLLVQLKIQNAPHVILPTSGRNSSPAGNYYSDSSNIGKNVEASFSKHGVQMPDSVRKSIDDARGGKMPDGLDI